MRTLSTGWADVAIDQMEKEAGGDYSQFVVWATESAVVW